MWLHRSPACPAVKWLGFVTAVWVQSVAGSIYSFSNYSQTLKIILNLTQVQLNNLSVAKDVGVVFGLLAGLSSNHLPTAALLLIGSIGGFLGYGGQWLVITNTIQPPPYWVMCIFMCLGGNAVPWLNTAVIVTSFRNFPNNRGPVSGILKGSLGLSTAIVTDLCTALLSGSDSAYLLTLAIAPVVVCLVASFFLREVPPSSATGEKEETRYFGFFNIVAVIVALYLLAFDLSGTHGHAFSVFFAVTLLILLASPLLIPLYVAFRNSNKSTSTSSSYSESEVTTPLLVSGEVSNPDTAAVEVEQRRRAVIGEDHTTWEALKTVDFWVLFLSFLFGMGPGTTVTNNLGQMAVAFGYKDGSIFVSLFSIAGFFGRIGSGWVSEFFIKKTGTPRPLWNAAAHIMMAIGFIPMALAVPGSLYLGSVLVGICEGALFAVTIPVASELFGLKNCGLIYNVIILNIPLGSFLFSGLIAGFLYDEEATSTAGGGNTCVGANCYRLVYVVMAIGCIMGFVLDVLLAFRTKNLYARVCASHKSKKAISIQGL